ncbi:alpha/beta hydrolase [Nesterenkonia aerolata]|uniref:Alpha/beta hydrolase n=1 Tax=Nesterenkonia aerolata TaxID=3074079 RepID=A0ABU2DQ74_9MICC|nr:alpha/beta hydrolase [Nesterenkonia sp. LY-0111]MDR8018657.1 alpha/beta hydrolase [Nesterenkonia sp. LY-0111]
MESTPEPQLLEDSAVGQWVPDILPGCSRRTLPLGRDEEGPVSATLVRLDDVPSPRQRPAASKPPAPVLHIHGWTDYFFNLPMARGFAASGRPFYALDLRKYGRSLREHQTPGYIDDLRTYQEELDAAVEIIAEAHPETSAPIVHAHSTGGLTAALWAADRPDRLSALILNAPWLELPGDVAARTAVDGLLAPLNRLDPKRALHVPPVSTYWMSLSEDSHGSWRIHPLWRPPESFPMRPGWLRAVLAGHSAVYRGLDISVPLLVLLSEKTVYRRNWVEEMQHSDSVLDVDLLARRAVKLGPTVTVERLTGAMHDIFASAEPIRREAFHRITRWLHAYGPEAQTDRSEGHCDT